MNELFELYKENGDISIRNKIAEHYLYIADILAKKFIGRGVEYDDLKQVASYALLRGIDRFDPSLGMQFTTFITPTITGEIKNYFRNFLAEYEAKHGEKPKVKVIAQALNLSEEDVVHALEVGGVLSLDTMASNEEGENTSLYSVFAVGEDKYEDFETKEMLRKATENFTDTEKELIKFRYVDELSQSETAARLGVSQMFVSRMERKLLLKLKDVLKDSI